MRLDGAKGRGATDGEKPDDAPVNGTTIITDEMVKVAQTPVKPPIRVTNLINSRQLADKLHLKAKVSRWMTVSSPSHCLDRFQSVPCPAHACLGSLMQNSGVSNENKRSKTEILAQAVEFIEEYFIHLKK